MVEDGNDCGYVSEGGLAGAVSVTSVLPRA